MHTNSKNSLHTHNVWKKLTLETFNMIQLAISIKTMYIDAIIYTVI